MDELEELAENFYITSAKKYGVSDPIPWAQLHYTSKQPFLELAQRMMDKDDPNYAE